ncbi:hypothetical protein ACOMHN_019637 [Nucella lapillus]
MNPVLAFLRRNIVLVVTIPSIIGLHYGWYCLQYNETFVPRNEEVKVLGFEIKAKGVDPKDSAVIVMWTKEPRGLSMFRRAALWAWNNKFASFLITFTVAYIATIPIVEPRVSTSTERAGSSQQDK